MAILTEQSKFNALSHAINNRMNAIAIGMSILEQHEHEEVRSVIRVLQHDFDELQDLLEQYRAELPK